MKLFGTEFKYNGNTVWHSGNDGSGSGLDADTVDGLITGNASGNIPISNGTLNTNLNADKLDGMDASSFYQNGSVIMNTNPFGGNKLYVNSLDNALFSADKKWYVTVTTHERTYNSQTYPLLNPSWVSSYTVSGSGTTRTVSTSPTDIIVYVDDTFYTKVTTPDTGNNYSYSGGTITFGKTIAGVVSAYPDHIVPQYLDSPIVSTLGGDNLFQGNYEGGLTVSTGYYMKIRIMPTSDGSGGFPGYPYGSFYLSHYYTNTSEKSEYRVFNRNYRPHGIGWKVYNFTDYVGTNTGSNYIQTYSDAGNYGRTILEFIVYAHPSHSTALTEIDWRLDRPLLSSTGSTVTKYGANKLYYDLTFGDQSTNKATISPTGAITGTALTSTVATGTSPLTVASTTVVPNLNVDKVDGYDATTANTASTVAVRDASNNINATTFTGALTGNSATSTKLITGRTVALTGDITGTSVAFDGSANLSFATTLANSGVTAGTYKSVTVNAKGLVTSGTNPTTLAGYGITDGASLLSPNFTGTPVAPTASINTNTTQLATTAFVVSQISTAGAIPIIIQATQPSSPTTGTIWIQTF